MGADLILADADASEKVGKVLVCPIDVIEVHKSLHVCDNDPLVFVVKLDRCRRSGMLACDVIFYRTDIIPKLLVRPLKFPLDAV